MTRLDRARIALAYEHLRGVRWVHGFGFAFYEGACESALDDAVSVLPRTASLQVIQRWHPVPTRLLRARLALYLRALMRADAGDFGPWVVTFYGHRTGVERRIRPLWESAPAHRVAHSRSESSLSEALCRVRVLRAVLYKGGPK